MKYVISLFVLLVNLSLIKDNDECYLSVFDQKTKKPILNSHVYSKEKEFITDGQGQFKIPCNFNDSILIHASGYEDSLLVFTKGTDTIFLLENTLELEPITVIGQSKKTKCYQIGKKNKKINLAYCFWGINIRKNELPIDFQLVSIFPNPNGVRMKVEEGYIYLENKDSLSNVSLTFYKNDNGKFGDLIADKILTENIKKSKGWCRLILNEKIILPKEGFIVVVKKIDLLNQNTSVGLIEYKKEMGIKSIVCLNNLPVPTLHNFENMGVKLYFKVR